LLVSRLLLVSDRPVLWAVSPAVAMVVDGADRWIEGTIDERASAALFS